MSLLEWQDKCDGSIREATINIKPFYVVATLMVFKNGSWYRPRVNNGHSIRELPAVRSWEDAEKSAIQAAIEILSEGLEILKNLNNNHQ